MFKVNNKNNSKTDIIDAILVFLFLNLNILIMLS